MLLHVGMFKGDIVDKVTLNRELVISGREHSKRRSVVSISRSDKGVGEKDRSSGMKSDKEVTSLQ